MKRRFLSPQSPHKTANCLLITTFVRTFTVTPRFETRDMFNGRSPPDISKDHKYDRVHGITNVYGTQLEAMCGSLVPRPSLHSLGTRLSSCYIHVHTDKSHVYKTDRQNYLVWGALVKVPHESFCANN